MRLDRAQPGDAAAIEAFLARFPETSMFLRANLAACGVSGPDSAEPTATEFWIGRQDGSTDAVFGITNGGFLMLQAPRAGRATLAAFVAAVAERQMQGLTGEEQQAKALIDALGFDDDAWRLNHGEPLYRLDLKQLDPVGNRLRPPVTADMPLLSKWFQAYCADTGLGEPTEQDATAWAEATVAEGNLRVLLEDGQPVAMTRLNARLPDIVQVGGVYVPPPLRNRGFGRRVVAAHLTEIREAGVKTAILFANNGAAARAYEAIGFRRVGTYRVAMLKGPRRIGAGGSA